MDLKKRRAAFIYRHVGPHGPKEGRPLQLEPLRRTQTALILFSLLQTTEKKRATGIKPMVRFARRRGCKPRLPVGPSLQVWKT